MQYYEAADQLTRAVKVIETNQPSRLDVTGKLVTLPEEGKVIVVGDLHGDFTSLKTLLKETCFIQRAREGELVFLIFLGDYIDRGPRQIEVLLEVTGLLIDYPSNVVLLRGNHEGPQDVVASPHDFPQELRRKFGENWLRVYTSFRNLADGLYTAVLVPKIAFLSHGGIPTNTMQLGKIASAHIDQGMKAHPKDFTWKGIDYAMFFFTLSAILCPVRGTRV